MGKVNRYEFEGEVIEVPVYWDDHLQREVEDYEDYCKQPGHTPSGRPILLTIEDACPYRKLTELDRVTVAETIKQIRVFGDGHIEITYTFSNELGLLETEGGITA